MSQTPERILAKIREAKEKQLKELDLSWEWDRPEDERLTQIPTELFELTQLEVLNLSRNKLIILPYAIGQLPNLTSLNLGGNQLTTIPDTITRLPNLTSLDLNNNQLTTIPTAITHLPNLTSLDLRGNQLTTVPDTITRLLNLTVLDLSSNPLNIIPDVIAKLKNLKALSLNWRQYTPLPEWVEQLPDLRLNLSNNHFITVPDWVFQLPNLTSLDLRGNELTLVPDAITQLQNLASLNLGDNQLSVVPDSITQLQNLTSLKLSHNQLTTLPDAMGQLQNLVELDLGLNQFTTFPESIIQLQKLVKLNLQGNELSAIPDSIIQLQNLTELNLGGNPLFVFPQVISQLKNLIELYLFRTELTSLPNSIKQLENLATLHLWNNLFTSIPEVLYELFSLELLSFWNASTGDKNRSDNQIKEISPKILQLKNLKILDLEDNPIEIPPPEVVAKGVEAIKEYFRQLEAEGKDYLYEAKLLIVGEGGAGKTTLAKKIEDAGYQLREDEVSTKGIEVIRWEFPFSPPSVPPKGGEAAALPPPGGVGGGPGQKTFRVNIWDFGGQEIYHATHQFFLTKRSLYALVADTRKEDTDFYYWLNVVELLSDNSPLLIILNEKQDRHREINERQLRGQFTNLKETLAANLATNRGLPDILSEIKHYLSHLPHIGTELPKTWVKVREALENDPRNHISLEAYLDICRQNGFQQRKDSLQLSGYLHDLGVCLHFQADPLLKKTVILKPEWGTAAVYQVLDDKTVIRNLGRFNRADLETIWHEPTYAAMQDELLQLMINFKLCYQIPGSGDYIAPQLLSANQPHYDWPDGNNLILRYTYDFMPKGILTQFIVAMQKWIADQRTVWKSGVILKKDRSAAEVIEYYDRREIRVRIIGQHKKELLTIVTYELDKIHDNYRRLKVNKLIPCNCVVCKDTQEPHFYPYEVLRNFTEARQEHIQCQRSFQMVHVWGLIDDVVDKSRLLKEKRALGSEWSEREARREHLLELIDIQTRKLRTLQVQRAKYGLDVPSHIVREIGEVEAELKRLEAELQDITPA
ncbi:MAG: hypothetical protein BroJett011_20110 [Chloroflexota bacterium]|nr:MAG: hypothetical protein BroJett011_20110 [Chloroflexota bacterium]